MHPSDISGRSTRIFLPTQASSRPPLRSPVRRPGFRRPSGADRAKRASAESPSQSDRAPKKSEKDKSSEPWADRAWLFGIFVDKLANPLHFISGLAAGHAHDLHQLGRHLRGHLILNAAFAIRIGLQKHQDFFF